MLGNDLWLKAAAGNFNRQFAKLALERLLALAIPGVPSRVDSRLIAGVAKVFSHLGFQCALNQFSGELLEQAMLTYQILGFLVIGQQPINQFVAYSYFFSSKNNSSFLQNDRLHKNSHTLVSYPTICPAGSFCKSVNQYWKLGK